MKINCQNFAAIYVIVKKHIDHQDPYGLLASGCPQDEFEFEAAEVTKVLILRHLDKPKALARAIVKIMIQSFDEREKVDYWLEDAAGMLQDIAAAPAANDWPIARMNNACITGLFLELPPKNGKDRYQDIVVLFSYGPAKKRQYGSAIFHNCWDVQIDKGKFKDKRPYCGAKFTAVSLLNNVAFLTFKNGLASLFFRYKKFSCALLA
jgi:hypothetical protein